MTNKEILQADLLDILFEHRNKLYGAYTLRKSYTYRLGLALGVALSVALLLILMSFVNKDKRSNGGLKHDDVVTLRTLEIPPDKPEEPEPQREIQRPRTALADHQQIIVVPDVDADDVIPDQETISQADVSNVNANGGEPGGLANTPTESEGTGSVVAKEPENNSEPVLPSRDPSFPGGPAAWLKFLQRHLESPADIEPGQRIEVYVRFWVDIDGSVSRSQIIRSGGSDFDNEVLRVLKKMPKWEPALQAGRPIAVAFQQPVIFIGQEE
jgi:protein TonB